MPEALAHAPYRISDVTELTGTSKEAIRFYINEGLLPKPHKTARNMAWYTDEHVRRIKLIKELQDTQFLPLKAIKALLQGSDDYDFTPSQRQAFAAMRARLQGPASEKGGYAHPVEATLHAYRVSREEFDALRDAGLIDVRASEAGPEMDESGQHIVQIWARIRDAGLTPERGFSPRDVEMLQSVVELLFEQEVRLFTSRFDDPTDSEAISVIERVVPLVNEALVVLHERRIRQFLDTVETVPTVEADSK